MAKISDRIRKGLYGTAAAIGRVAGELKEKVQRREGLIGKVGGKLEDIATSTVDTGREMHEQIKANGGYIAAAKRAGQAIATSVKDAYNSLETSVKDNFFTDGKFDGEKAKQALRDTGSSIKQYGKKAYDALAKATAQGADAVRQDFRRYIPTTEEKDTIYAGIGTKYSGILFRDHYIGCLKFIEHANKKIPAGTSYRNQVLEDIKASASSEKQELLDFYSGELMKCIDDEAQTRAIKRKTSIAHTL